MDNPDRYEIWIAREADEIRGYIVGKVGIWKSLRVGYIADYIEDGEGEVFDLLLAKAMYHFQNENVHMIAAWTVGGSHYATVLKQSGFLKAWDIPVICYWNQVGVDVTSTVKRWHFTMADSDNI